MTRIFILLFLILMTQQLVWVEAAWQKENQWLEIPEEYRKEISEQIKASKQYTAEQLSVITDCLSETSVAEILNCLSAGGIDEAAGILTLIRDKVSEIRERICGGSALGNKDSCDKLSDSLIRFKQDLQEAWSVTVAKGKQYLAEKNRVLTMKRSICNRIKQEGCYQWLNDRIELKCNPKKIGTNPTAIETCQWDVVEEVWQRLNSGQ